MVSISRPRLQRRFRVFWELCLNLCSLTWLGPSINLFWVMKKNYFLSLLVRIGIKIHLLWKTRCFILARSLLSSEVVFTESWITGKREVSSVKSSILEDKPSAKTLIYIKNSNGLRMEPWVTPTLTLVHEEDCPFNTTFCFLFLKKCFKTFNKLPDIPLFCNLNIRPSCETLSNAFEMSKALTS